MIAHIEKLFLKKEELIYLERDEYNNTSELKYNKYNEELVFFLDKVILPNIRRQGTSLPKLLVDIAHDEKKQITDNRCEFKSELMGRDTEKVTGSRILVQWIDSIIRECAIKTNKNEAILGLAS